MSTNEREIDDVKDPIFYTPNNQPREPTYSETKDTSMLWFFERKWIAKNSDILLFINWYTIIFRILHKSYASYTTISKYYNLLI